MTIQLPLTTREMNALLHLIAAANSNGHMRAEPADAAIGTYLVDRMLRLTEPFKEPAQ
jgi:hypothetical protein